MPRYHYYPKKKNVGGIVATILGIILLLGLVGGIAYKSEGFRNWDVKNWFPTQSEVVDDSSKEEAEEDSSGVTITGEGMTEEEGDL